MTQQERGPSTMSNLRADDYLDALTDMEVAEVASTAINDLCSQKRRWTMSIPPDRRDQDLIFSELVKRFLAIARREERLREALVGFIDMPTTLDDFDKVPIRVRVQIDELRQAARAALTPEEGQTDE